MKFSRVVDIYNKFFKINFSGHESLTLRSAYRRLQLLEENSFLLSTKNFESAEKLYLLSAKGYYLLLRTNRIHNTMAFPVRKIDSRTYAHDLKLIQIRQRLESDKKINKWVSERSLKSEAEYLPLQKQSISPDALIVDAVGNKYALELELTLKSKNRYKEKIKNIVDYLRNTPDNEKSFIKVIYLVDKKSIKSCLFSEILIYKRYFYIFSVDEFLNYSGGVKCD